MQEAAQGFESAKADGRRSSAWAMRRAPSLRRLSGGCAKSRG